MNRSYSTIDQILIQAQTGLQQFFGPKITERPRPQAESPETAQSSAEKKHTAGLLRINHSGEVCAQALYFGQALFARSPAIRAQLQAAALEEMDHLYWCEARLKELGGHTSFLNPIWYSLSVLIGIWASLRGDAFSLGFIHATEAQVEQHLDDHLAQVPEHDIKTRALLAQMKADEAAHGTQALLAGGERFSDATQAMMRRISAVMTVLT